MGLLGFRINWRDFDPQTDRRVAIGGIAGTAVGLGLGYGGAALALALTGERLATALTSGEAVMSGLLCALAGVIAGASFAAQRSA